MALLRQITLCQQDSPPDTSSLQAGSSNQTVKNLCKQQETDSSSHEKSRQHDFSWAAAAELMKQGCLWLYKISAEHKLVISCSWNREITSVSNRSSVLQAEH